MEAGTDKQSWTRHIVNTWAASCMHHSSKKARQTIPRDTRVLTLQRPHLSRHPVIKSAQRQTHHYRMPDHQSCRPAALETSDLSSRHAHFLFVSSSTARISSSKICTSSNLYSSFFFGPTHQSPVATLPSGIQIHLNPKFQRESLFGG